MRILSHLARGGCKGHSQTPVVEGGDEGQTSDERAFPLAFLTPRDPVNYNNASRFRALNIESLTMSTEAELLEPVTSFCDLRATRQRFYLCRYRKSHNSNSVSREKIFEIQCTNTQRKAYHFGLRLSEDSTSQLPILYTVCHPMMPVRKNGSEVEIAESFSIGRIYEVLGCKVGREA
jgi:hypothetical protein